MEHAPSPLVAAEAELAVASHNQGTQPDYAASRLHTYANKLGAALRNHAGRLALCAVLSISGVMPETSLAGNTDAQNFPPPAASQEAAPGSQGAWITFGKSGYYAGRYLPAEGDTLRVINVNRARTYAGVIVRHNDAGVYIDQCGYVAAAAIPKSQLKPKKHVNFPGAARCRRELKKFRDRNSFGVDFNCVAHLCVDGTIASNFAQECDEEDKEAYYNYLFVPGVTVEGHKLPPTKNGFYDSAGELTPNDILHYRFTTRNRQAADSRTHAYSWIYLPRGCVTGNLQGGALLVAPLNKTLTASNPATMTPTGQLPPRALDQEAAGIVW
jgi:hypothetical protein